MSANPSGNGSSSTTYVTGTDTTNNVTPGLADASLVNSLSQTANNGYYQLTAPSSSSTGLSPQSTTTTTKPTDSTTSTTTSNTGFTPIDTTPTNVGAPAIEGYNFNPVTPSPRPGYGGMRQQPSGRPQPIIRTANPAGHANRPYRPWKGPYVPGTPV